MRSKGLTTALLASLCLGVSFLGCRETAPTPAPKIQASSQTAAGVALSAEAQRNADIATTVLTSIRRLRQVRAFGTVVPVNALAETKARYLEARARNEKAAAALAASQKDYDRIKKLYEADRNASERAFQVAEASYKADLAESAAAQTALRLAEDTVRQDWGEGLAGLLKTEDAQLAPLLEGRKVLVQATLPPETRLDSVPKEALVQPAAGPPLPARLLSLSPRTDPRFQGPSYYYAASNEAHVLLAGMNVTVYLSAGEPTQGVLLPFSSVIRWQGQTCVYVKAGPARFERRTLSTDEPSEGGWFVAKGLSPGEEVVVRGAQQLLSEEFKGQAQPAGEGEGE